MVFSPHAFDGAPLTDLATLTFPNGGTPEEEGSIVRASADAFPMVTAVRVKDALDAIGAIVANLVVAIRGASAITLLAAALVLGGALAAGHRHRVYDAVILKTLGATRSACWPPIRSNISCSAAPPRVRRAQRLARRLADRHGPDALALRLAALPALVAAFGAVVVTVVLGLVGTFSALGQKPAPSIEESRAFAAFRRGALPPDGVRAFRAIMAGVETLTTRHDAGLWSSISGAQNRQSLHLGHERDGVWPARLT